jgi:polygalacturonase
MRGVDLVLRKIIILLLSMIICVFTVNTTNLLAIMKSSIAKDEPITLTDDIITYNIPTKTDDISDVTQQIAEEDVNVTDYGVKGDGITDDTYKIQNAINYVSSKGGGTVYIPDGTYIIDPDISLKLKSNIRLLLSENTILKASSSSEEYYNILLILNATNVQIAGGKIVGDRYIHSGTTGEWGSGISILGSTNVSISDISICDCWGDGIYIGSSWDGTSDYQNYSDNINIENFHIFNNRRQGISVISAKNLTIRDGEVSNSNGTRPEAGINLEPNNSEEFLQNVLIDNVMTRDNSRIGILVSLPTYNGSLNVLSVTINNHNDIGSPYPISYYRYYESDTCKITVYGTDPHNITSFY